MKDGIVGDVPQGQVLTTFCHLITVKYNEMKEKMNLNISKVSVKTGV